MWFGTEYYGKCDNIPGVCFVATSFFSVCYFPLVPLETHALFKVTYTQILGTPVAFSTKSFLLAWSRAALVLGLIIGFVLSVMSFNEHELSTTVCIIATVVMAIALLASHLLFKKTSKSRMSEIAKEIGFNDEGIEALNKYYDEQFEFGVTEPFSVLPEHLVSITAPAIACVKIKS